MVLLFFVQNTFFVKQIKRQSNSFLTCFTVFGMKKLLWQRMIAAFIAHINHTQNLSVNINIYITL